MIIWSKLGFLVLVILIVSFILVGFLFDTFTGIPNYSRLHALPDVISFVFAGVLCWFVGRGLNKPGEKVLIDKETGEEVILKNGRHSLFFIKMEYWGLILVIVGIINIFTNKNL